MERLDRKSKEYLQTFPNVVGVGHGYKVVKGRQTEQEAIVVLVRIKLSLQKLADDEIIPQTVNNMVTDVVEIGTPRAYALDKSEKESKGSLAKSEAEILEEIGHLQQRTEKVRPAPPGVSIGHYLITAGTFGTQVYDNSTAQPLILSNNHVLANATNGNDQRASVGDRIYQPGPYDFAHTDLGFADRPYIIACLKRYVALVDYPSINLVDCAVGEPLENTMIVPDILDIGLVQGMIAPSLNLPVKKSGRTTGVTFGQITVVDALVDVQYDPSRILRFDHQIITTNMSSPGDSGSLLLDNNNLAVGLLFAGSSVVTIHNPIQSVLDLLDVNFG